MSVFLTSVAIGLLALDTTIAFQMLIAQPVFACSLLGIFLGHPLLGVEIGAMLQLLWINIMPVGAARVPESNVAAMITCACAILFAIPAYENSVLTLAFLWGLLGSPVAAMVTVWYRKANDIFLESILRAAAELRYAKIQWLNAGSVLLYFVSMLLVALLFLVLANLFFPLILLHLPANTEMALRFVRPAIWAVGITLTIQFMWQGRRQA